MGKLKSHKTVEEIAKKHKVEPSFIENQLKVGISIEKEHTTDNKIATDIALQHLDEFPDYYTRLKKMESNSKNEKSVFLNSVKELEEELKKLKDTSYNSIDKLMRRIMKKYNMTAKELHNAFVDKHKETPDDWIKSIKEGTLHHWFKGSKSKDGKPGWVQSDGSPCANEPGETKTPKCFSSARLSQLKSKGKKGKSLISSAVRRKREKDPNQQDKSSGASPTMVRTFAKHKKDPNYIEAEPKLKEEMEITEAQKDKPSKGSGKKDACYHKVKSKYSVFPSAYACVPEQTSKALTRDGWKNVNQLNVGVEIMTYNINTDELEFKPILNLYRYKNAKTKVIQSGNTGFVFESTENHKWVVKLPKVKGKHPQKYNRIADKTLMETEDLLTNKSNKHLVVSAPYNGGEEIIKNKIFKYGDNWVKYILDITKEQRQSWLFSAIIYDGNQKKVERLIENKNNIDELNWSFTSPRDKQSFEFKQKDIMHRDAFLLSAFLNSGLVTWKKITNNNIYSCNYTSNKRFKNIKNFKLIGENIQDVWCPETGNSTWVMMQETNDRGIITITGNSGALVQCRKKGASNWGTSKEENEMDLNKSSVLESSELRYCPKCKKNETREECAYGSKYWDKYATPPKKYSKESKDHEYSMARSQLSTITSAAQRLKKKMKGEGNIEAWVQSKITKAADYLDTAADYIDSGEHDVEESISFDIGPQHNKNKKREKIRKLAKGGATEGERQAAFNKLGKTPELPNVRKEEKLVDKILDETCWPGYKRKKGTKKYSTGSCVKSENVSIEDANGNTFAEVIDIVKPGPIKGFKSQIDEVTRLQSQSGNVIAIVLNWRGKYYSLKMFFPQVKLPSRNDINAELQKVYPGSKVVTHSVSEIQPGQPLIQAFGPQGGSSAKPGPNINYIKPMGEEVEFNEDWQKVNRKDKTDGLSQKAVDAYKRENPGSNLQTAVTEKNPKGKRASRRKAFCRRMTGMRSKLTSSKTARDPDSRINKALRRWRCN